MNSRRAFTFVEVLLVTALIASLSLAVFSCLANGLKLWDRSRSAVLFEDVMIFFDKFSSDLRNTSLFSTLAIEGSEYVFAFPSVVLTTEDPAKQGAGDGLIAQIGRVRYSFDAAAGAVLRQQAGYSEGIRKDWESQRFVMQGIEELRFRYFYHGRKDPQAHVDSGEVLPLGVEVVVVVREGQQRREFRRFIGIPLGT